MTTEDINTLMPTIDQDGKYCLKLTLQEFNEISYALQVLKMKRDASRAFQRKKYEKVAAKSTGEKHQYRKSMNLIMINPKQ